MRKYNCEEMLLAKHDIVHRNWESTKQKKNSAVTNVLSAPKYLLISYVSV